MFRMAADGRKLFFPWGAMGKGYVIADEASYERIRKTRKILLGSSFVFIVAALALQRQHPFAPYYVAAAYAAAYGVWARFAVGGLLPTDEKLTMREFMVSHPKVYSPFILWPLEIASLVFVIGGIVMLVKDASSWQSTLSGVVFFSFCAAVFAYVLVLRASLHRSDS